MRRVSWTGIVLALVAALGLGLWATGRLELRWSASERPTADGHDHGKDDASEDEGRVKGDKAVLDAEAIRVGGLRSQPATTGSVAVALEALGEVQAPDERIAHVTPRVGGVVRDIYKARGESVKAGDALAVLESTDLGEARAAYDTSATELKLADVNVDAWKKAQAKATPAAGPVGWLELDQALAERQAAETELTVAERNYARLDELQQQGLRSRTELLSAEADLARARARLEAAKRRIQVLGQVANNDAARARQRVAAAETKLRSLGGDTTSGGDRSPTRIVVRSPIAGVVTGRDLTLGQTVEPTARIFSIADPSEVWVTAAIYDKDVRSVRPDQPATVRVQGLGDAVFTGRVAQVGPHVDEKTRTLPVRVVVRQASANNGALLRPGMFATVALETARRTGVVLVPVAAIQTLDGEPIVFVETPLSEGAAYQRRPVKVGVRDGDAVEILEGVSASERVVVANAYLLKSEFERSKIGQGHAH